MINISENMAIIKLGGAAITNKLRDFTLQGVVLDRVMREIQQSGIFPIIVHGAGSFAHNLANYYKLSNGYDPSISVSKQQEGIALTRSSLEQLHKYVLNAALNAKLRPFSTPVSATLISRESTAIAAFFTDSIKMAITNNLIPIMYGDIIFDSISKFRVISGDRIITLICEYLSKLNIIDQSTNNFKIIYGSNVDGLFDINPKNPKAKLYDNLYYDEIIDAINLAEGSESPSTDVTQGMKGKLLQIKKIVDMGFQVTIVNITKPKRLFHVLSNQETVRTNIYPKNND